MRRPQVRVKRLAGGQLRATAWYAGWTPPNSGQQRAAISSTMTHAPSDELGDEHDCQRAPRGDGPEPVDQDAIFAPGAAALHPVHDHAGLGQGEGQERPDGEQGDQVVGDPAVRDQQRPGQQRQDDDPLGVDQPPAAVGEAVGQVAVLGHGPAQPREVGEPGVRRQRTAPQAPTRS